MIDKVKRWAILLFTSVVLAAGLTVAVAPASHATTYQTVRYYGSSQVTTTIQYRRTGSGFWTDMIAICAGGSGYNLPKLYNVRMRVSDFTPAGYTYDSGYMSTNQCIVRYPNRHNYGRGTVSVDYSVNRYLHTDSHARVSITLYPL